MKRFVYPMVLYKDSVENGYIAKFPDLEVVTDGSSIEEAYLRAKDYLQTYLELMEKYENDINPSSEYLKIANENAKKIVLLSDAVVKSAENVSDKQKQYRDFVRKFFTTEG